MSPSTIYTKLRIGFAAMLALFFLTISQAPVQAQQFLEGRDYARVYTPIATSSPGKIEVAYMFSYSSPHSYQYERTMFEWKRRLPNHINLIYMPVGWSAPMALDRQLFYTLQALGLPDQAHQLAFDTYHVQRQRVATIDQWAGLFAQQGVNRQQFLQVANSFQIRGIVQQADNYTRSAGVRGLPSIVVNGQYLVNMPRLEDTLRVTEFLVNKIMAETANR